MRTFMPTILPNIQPNCTGSLRFDIRRLQGIRNELDLMWPHLKNYRESPSFWKHEFEKHGLCAVEDPQVFNQYGYFKFGIQLMQKLNLLKTLMKYKISPHDSRQYDTINLMNVLEREFGYNGSANCIRKPGRRGMYHLEEVHVCLNRKHEFMNCPFLGNCPKKFIFPPFQ
ncbi:unnamed protein product [Schistosoma rodhaini]|uniref:Uncharacterized protein n=1 Tax=Schistosoma rodhaini TaxID=6188 RepID=A0AA85FCQ3_9TREM|nr:unnamed protein product [Schistosoma rodhaini]